MLLSTAPLWFVRLPPLIDLLGHMGRYHVQLNLAHSPVLQRNWDFHWTIVGNLGVDLLIVPLAKVLGLERAVWLVALALPPLMIWGVARISRALHGRLTPFAIACAPFALANPYQYGFVNYWLACALALHAFASWARSEENGDVRRSVLFATGAALIWLTHVYGWAILVVLVFAFELCRNWRREPSKWFGMSVTILRRMWPVMIPAVLTLVWRQGAASAETLDFFNFAAKFEGLSKTLRDQNHSLDRLSLLFAAGLLGWGLISRRTVGKPALLVAAAILLALILVLPRQLFGSGFADVRLWPIFFIVALTALAPREPSWRGAPLIAAAALALFAVRVAVMGAGFVEYDQTYARRLKALDYAPRGASIAVLVAHPRCDGWRQERVSHLDDLAIVRRDAFVNTQWEIPGGQLLTPLRARGDRFNADPSQFVLPAGGCQADFRSTLTRKIAQIPRDRFEYLWLIGFDPSHVDPPPGAQRLYADDRSEFYALRSEVASRH
jgi:hypothetical protein